MDIQTFKAPDGTEMAVLPRADLAKLEAALENVEDANTIREFQRKFAAGEEELIPSEFADRLVNGENPIRVWREYRGFKAKELAEKAGISTAYLSEIETGKKEGRVGTLAAIADVLNLTIDDLV